MSLIRWCGILILLACCIGNVCAHDMGGTYYAYLFSSNYCNSCEQADMFIFTEITTLYPELVIIDYELSGHTVNALVNRDYSEIYGTGNDVPKIIFGDNLTLKGMNPIIGDTQYLLESKIKESDSESLFQFNQIDLGSLEGYPKLWRANRVLIFEEGGAENAFLKDLINTPDINRTLAGHPYETITQPSIRVGKQNIIFEHAVRVEGWVLQWNDVPVDANSSFATPLAVWGTLFAVMVAAIGMKKMR